MLLFCYPVVTQHWRTKIVSTATIQSIAAVEELFYKKKKKKLVMDVGITDLDHLCVDDRR